MVALPVPVERRLTTYGSVEVLLLERGVPPLIEVLRGALPRFASMSSREVILLVGFIEAASILDVEIA